MSARYPDVPDAPGVPLVFRRDTTPAAPPVAPLAADALGGVAAARVTWGIFTRGGALALEPDSIVVVEPSREFQIADYPVENGGFRSYNKVATPAVERITLTKGGDVAARAAFQAAVEKMLESTDLFTIVTPDATYLNRNLVRRDMRRGPDAGAQLLTIELQMQEVRLSAALAFTASPRASDAAIAPKSASGANRVNNGPVQPAALSDDAQLDALIEAEKRQNSL